MATPNITIRGIRQAVPAGYILGRLAAGDGQVQLISTKDLGQHLVSIGAVTTPGGGGSISGKPSDFTIFFSGKPGATQVLAEFQLTRAITLPINLGGSYFGARVAATSTYVATINQNGIVRGTITYTSVGTTVSFTAAVALAAGDTLQVVGQAVSDATLQDLWLAFQATFT